MAIEARNSLKIVLVSPRIAANVGNVARTCKALGAELHLVGPLGFFLDPKHVKRSSVGYWEEVQPLVHRDAQAFWSFMEEKSPRTAWYWATKNGSSLHYDQDYRADVGLIFGNEEEGVDPSFWKFESKSKGLPGIVSCRIPMCEVRCLNLATSVGIIGYEVVRQWHKQGGLCLEDVKIEDGNRKRGLV